MISGGLIDTHIHLWDLDTHHYPWLDDPDSAELRSNYLPDDFRGDAKDVDVVATVHVQAELDHAVDPVAETSWLASVATSNDAEPAVPTVCVGYADLRSPTLNDVLDRHQNHTFFRGIRQEAWYDPHSTKADVPTHNLLDDPDWVIGLHEVAARDLSFDLLVWPHQLRQAASIIRDIPDLTVILEHTGLPVDPEPEQREVWRTGMRLFATHVPHSLLKLSALRFVSAGWSVAELTPVVRESIEIFGPDRCILGSNFPVDKPAISYTDLWAAFDEMTSIYSPAERAGLFRDNAARAYRIEL